MDESKAMNALYDDIRDRYELVVVMKEMPLGRLGLLGLKFMKVEYPVIIDPKGNISQSFGVMQQPVTFYFDPQGTLVHVGPVDGEEGEPEKDGAEGLRHSIEAVFGE